MVAGTEPADTGADGIDRACDVPTESDVLMGSEQASLTDGPVAGGDVNLGDRRGMDPDAELPWPGLWDGNVAQLKHFGTAELRDSDGEHLNVSYLVVFA
jgi:hypothetical protein